jgi:hypothetical protein
MDIKSVYCPEHLPVILQKTDLDNFDVDNWLQDRYISVSRKDVDKLLKKLNLNSPIEILFENSCLSLTDHYWLCDARESKKWKDINFFDNSFSEDIGNFLIGNYKAILGRISPEASSGGSLVKKWHIENNERYLLKGSTFPYYQQPANEVVASNILDALNVEHTKYSLVYDKHTSHYYSSCKNYLGRDNDEVPALEAMKIFPKTSNETSYEHYIHTCERLDIPDAVNKINQMMFIDFLICNVDRHLKNYGLIRNAETLRYVNVIPVFDNGNSLWHESNINYNDDIALNFEHSHTKNIKLIKDFTWLDTNKLKYIREISWNVLKDYHTLDNERKEKLCDALCYRVKSFRQTLENKQAFNLHKSVKPSIDPGISR